MNGKRVIGYLIVGTTIFRLDGQADEKWKNEEFPGEQGQVVFDETRGNWYYKRQFYKGARDLYQKIRARVEEVDKLKTVFFQKRTMSDESVAQFNLELGFEQGEVDELLNNLINSLTQEREKMIELTEHERQLDQELKDKKASIEQLKKDLSVVTEIDNALDTAMAQVLEKISTARSFEEKSWQSYEKIAAEINDKKAEQYYNDMKSYYENIDQIGNYLTSQLMPFFDQKTDELQNHMTAVKDRLAQLKAQGIELSKKVNEDEQDDERRLAEKKKRAAEAAAKKAAVEEPGLWNSIKNAFSRMFSWVADKFSFGENKKGESTKAAVANKPVQAASGEAKKAQPVEKK